MTTGAVVLDIALIAAFAAGILYWGFVTPKRERDRWRKQLDVGHPPPPNGSSPWDGDPDRRRD